MGAQGSQAVMKFDLQVIYPFSEVLPLKKARAIQYIKTCSALAESGARVHAIFGKDKDYSDDDCLAYYGLRPHKNLHLWRLPILRKREGQRFGLSWNGLFNRYCAKTVASLVNNGTPSVLFLRHLKLANYLIQRGISAKAPMIFEAHEVFSSTTDRAKGKETLRAMEESVFRSAKALISISHGLKDELERGYQALGPIHVIPDGADVDVLSDAFNHSSRSSGRTICYTGHLYPWKGVDTLVQAMSFLSEATLTIVGGDEADIQRLKRLARESGCLDRITFEGWVAPEKVAGYLQKASVAVIPLGNDLIASRFTSPLKLFEYMAAGIPVVASDLPSIKEILVNDVNAVLVQPEAPDKLAAGIRRVLDDGPLARRIASQALLDVREYSWLKRGEKISRICRSAIEDAIEDASGDASGDASDQG